MDGDWIALDQIVRYLKLQLRHGDSDSEISLTVDIGKKILRKWKKSGLEIFS